jgi:hypothetical protein
VPITTTSFDSQEAPCGEIVDGERRQERDDLMLFEDSVYYSCGCARIRRNYHDGSFFRKVIHHNGKVLVDELFHR